MSATELLDAPTTAIAKPQPINWAFLREQALASFEIQSEAIAGEVAADTLLMVGNSGERAAANKRRMVWVRRRTDLERTRKAAQADAKKIVELVKEVAEKFQADFSKAEDHLAEQIDTFDAQMAAAEKEKADRFFNDRNSQLQHVGITLARVLVESLSEADIEQMISDKVEANRLAAAESERLAAAKFEADRVAAEQAEANRREAEKLKAEREKLDAERAEQAAVLAKQQEELLADAARRKKIDDDAQAEVSRKQAEQQAELDAQRVLIEAAQRKIEEAAFAVAEREREQREAEQNAERLKVLNEKAAQDAAAKLEQEKADAEAARQRAELLRPDVERLLAFADQVQGMKVPDIRQTAVMADIANALLGCADEIRRIVDERVK